MKKSSDNYKSPVRRHDTAKQISTDAMSSSSSLADSDSTCSMMTPSLEFPDRISFRKMDLSEAGSSGVVVTSNSTDQKITELMPPVRRGDKTTVKHINTDGVSSSSSFPDSDSTCSMITPSLEFPDRISFRKMDLCEAASSSSSSVEDLSVSTSSLITHSLEIPDHTSLRISGVDGEMDRIYRSLGVSGPDDLAIKSSFNLDNHHLARDLSEAGPSGVVVASNSTNRDITKLMPPVRRRNKPTLIRRNHSSFKEIIARMKKSSGRRGDKITPVRRLERRDAAKHINYDAASSSSSSAEDLYVSASSSSLEVPDPTSFRIGGAEGENRGGIERKPPILVKSKGYLVPNDAVAVGGGIKGVRQPILKRPPIDLHGSSWDFLTHFAPESETVRRPSSSSIITSWQKGQLLGRGSFGSVYEGIAGDGDFFAINEVSLLDQGSHAQECIQHHERDIGLLNHHVNFDAMSSSGSFVSSNLTSSLMTPSMEFPDRISFRKIDLTEAGPSGIVADRENTESTRSESITIGNFNNPEDMGLVTSWLNDQILGRRSFDSIYEDISVDRDFFAVKEVSFLDQGSQTQECIQQLEGEIALLSQLQHQNIVRYRGTAKDGSNLYIFLELVTQGSLLKLYQRYQLRNSVVSTYTRQILDGLKYLHDKGFIHRDIRCANILLDANGAAKLADFGLAKFNDIKSCKGTPFWMAPEVFNPKRNDGYGSPADIWSLGFTVLEMLTRQIPYGSLEPVQALFKMARGTLPDIPDTLSLDARNFVIECLKVNPEERPTAAELLNHPFVRRPLLSRV